MKIYTVKEIVRKYDIQESTVRDIARMKFKRTPPYFMTDKELKLVKEFLEV